MERLGRVYKSINENIKYQSSCFKHESKESNRSMSIFEELMKIEGLTTQERVRVGMTIGVFDTGDIFRFLRFIIPENTLGNI